MGEGLLFPMLASEQGRDVVEQEEQPLLARELVRRRARDHHRAAPIQPVAVAVVAVQPRGERQHAGLQDLAAVCAEVEVLGARRSRELPYYVGRRVEHLPGFARELYISRRSTRRLPRASRVAWRAAGTHHTGHPRPDRVVPGPEPGPRCVTSVGPQRRVCGGGTFFSASRRG